MKTLNKIFKQDKERLDIPKSVQDIIPVKRIWNDGIFLVGNNKYSKSFKFNDINYAVASKEDKEAMFLDYSDLLNSLDTGTTTEITINNRRMNKLDFEKRILLKDENDNLNEYRHEYNEMLINHSKESNGIVQEKIITISVYKNSVEEARSHFSRTGADLINKFATLGSKCVELNAEDRLRIAHDEELLKQEEPEAKEIALAIELFTNGSLNTFAMNTNVDTSNKLICYDILELGKQLLPIGMLVVLDSILNRITANRTKGKHTYIFIDEIYLIFQYEYSANFLFTLWKRVRKYGALATGITQNVEDLLQSHTARTMLSNSEFIIMLNQSYSDRIELAKLLNISDLQMSYITNVGAGEGLIKVGSSLVPFINRFPKDTKLYKLMSTKPGEGINE